MVLPSCSRIKSPPPSFLEATEAYIPTHKYPPKSIRPEFSGCLSDVWQKLADHPGDLDAWLLLYIFPRPVLPATPGSCQGCYLQGQFIVPQRKNILHFSEWPRLGLHFWVVKSLLQLNNLFPNRLANGYSPSPQKGLSWGRCSTSPPPPGWSLSFSILAVITFQYCACIPEEFMNVAQVGGSIEGGGKFQS